MLIAKQIGLVYIDALLKAINGVCVRANALGVNKEGNMIQQGDVILVKVLEIKGKKLDHLTLAKGEVTGHHHTITEGDAELFEQEGILYLRVNSEEAKLTHQEHSVVTIPKGDYKINIVREYDHFDEEARNVRD